ncbi:MAG: hypothetical protein WA851_11650, partial [Xanthobacteraceae bacterium]
MMPENDYDAMSESYREAFQCALVRTFDWIRHSGPEPEVDLNGTSIAAQTLFNRMTKFGLDQMPAIEIQLTCEILGGTRDAERDAVTSTPSYGNAARYLVRRIKERKVELQGR